MNISEIITLWSENRGLSLLIWTVLLVTAMYLARSSAHQSIAAAMRSLRAVMRMTASSLTALEQRMVERNKQVILQAGQENTERAIEREFYRVNAIVERDLSGYPATQRTVTDLINKIETRLNDRRYDFLLKPLEQAQRSPYFRDAISPDASPAELSGDRKSTRLNSSHTDISRMPSSA